MLRVEPVACLQDNYAYLVRDEASRKVAVVDPSEAGPIMARAQELKWSINYLICTHHHWDHVGGNEWLKSQLGVPVLASHYDKDRVPGCTQTLGEGERFVLGETEFKVLEIPGHTLGHIALYSEKAKVVFTGDTLFSLGCGRLFEGTPVQMWKSLTRLMNLPLDTKIYCGHEYTQSHLKFVQAVDPHNPELKNFKVTVPSVPTTVEIERKLNPFLRAGSLEKFAELRAFKDNFKS